MTSEVRVDQLAAIVEQRADGDAVAALVAAVEVADDLRGVAEELLDRYVAAAREEGRSWSEIGTALGVSRQAAQQRFVSTPVDPTAWPKDFDEDARAVVHAAQRHARSFRHRYLGTEHLLLALSAHSDAVAAQLLRDLAVSDERLREQLGELLAGEAPELADMIRQPPRRRLRRRPRRRGVAYRRDMTAPAASVSDIHAARSS